MHACALALHADCNNSATSRIYIPRHRMRIATTAQQVEWRSTPLQPLLGGCIHLHVVFLRCSLSLSIYIMRAGKLPEDHIVLRRQCSNEQRIHPQGAYDRILQSINSRACTNHANTSCQHIMPTHHAFMRIAADEQINECKLDFAQENKL